MFFKWKWCQAMETTQYPSTYEFINKMWFIHTMGYYLSLKRNEVLIHPTTWMNFENIMLSERSQKQQVTYCMIPFIWNVQNRHICRDRKQICSCRAYGGFLLGWWKCSRWWLHTVHAQSLQSRLTLCDPVDSSSPGSSVHGIHQARMLAWIANSFSRSHMNVLISLTVNFILFIYFFNKLNQIHI